MQNTELELKRRAVTSTIVQVYLKYAEEIDDYLREESRDLFDYGPKIDVGDGDQTLNDIFQETRETGETGYLGYLEDSLEEWLVDHEFITERQYPPVAEDEDGREEILLDLTLSFVARTKYQDLPTSSKTE
jgi:hypothetical protein